MTRITDQGRAGLGIVTIGVIAAFVSIGVANWRASAPALAPAIAATTPGTDAVARTEAPRAEAGFEIVKASDPEGAAMTLLTEKYGVLCTMGSDVTFVEDPSWLTVIDDQVAQQRLTGGWI